MATLLRSSWNRFFAIAVPNLLRAILNFTPMGELGIQG
jgi:hypothetical protein